MQEKFIYSIKVINEEEEQEQEENKMAKAKD